LYAHYPDFMVLKVDARFGSMGGLAKGDLLHSSPSSPQDVSHVFVYVFARRNGSMQTATGIFST
jgi:hypothetical protein